MRLDPARMTVRQRTVLGRGLRRAYRWISRVAAVGPDDDLGRRFAAFGDGTFLGFPQGSIFNEHKIRLGSGTMFGPDVTLTAGMVPGQEFGSDPVIEIGDRVNIGRGSFIVAHCSIVIGDDVTTGPGIYITDQNHSYADPEVPITLQWPIDDPVRVGSGCWLGTGCVILPGANIGRNVVVAANAVVGGDVPDNCVVAGAPARIVRRYTNGQWDPPLRRAPGTPPANWPGVSR